MAAAYRYADGSGPMPEHLARLRYIDRFGVQAVTGRAVLGGYQMRLMVIAENVVNAYHQREKWEGGWAKWAADNPQAAELLNNALRAAEDGEG